MPVKKQKPCRDCKGKGELTCCLGTLRCGRCLGDGRDREGGFVANVKRQLGSGRSDSAADVEEIKP